MSSKTIICLANSRRYGGRCIAGKEVNPDGSYGEWVRPVTSEASEQIEESIGKNFNLLDIIKIPIKDKQNNEGHQKENWLVDDSREWQRVRIRDYDEAKKALDLEPPQWMVEGTDSSKGVNDQFKGEAESSLCLIQVNNFTAEKSEGYRAIFCFHSKKYDLRITDVKISDRYNKMNNVLLCISLIGGGAVKTKLIAGVIIPNMGV